MAPTEKMNNTDKLFETLGALERSVFGLSAICLLSSGAFSALGAMWVIGMPSCGPVDRVLSLIVGGAFALWSFIVFAIVFTCAARMLWKFRGRGK